MCGPVTVVVTVGGSMTVVWPPVHVEIVGKDTDGDGTWRGRVND